MGAALVRSAILFLLDFERHPSSNAHWHVSHPIFVHIFVPLFWMFIVL
jgi:hypothetical protein